MEGKMLNIPSHIEDPSYRYKMPALQLRIEGRLNGVKTKIVNCEDIAKALRVPATYPLKFLGYELGSQTHDKDFIINGEFKEPEMRKHMDKFIEKYVLCGNCHYPEMVMKVKKGLVTGSCNSCGHKATLDNVHKLAVYIQKNPPKNVSEFKDDKGKKGAKTDKPEKVEKVEKVEKPSKKEKDTPKKTEDGDSSEDEAPKDLEKEAKEKERKEKKEKREELQALENKVPLVYDFKANEEALVAKINEVYKKHASLESFEDQDDAINDIINAAKALDLPSEHQSKIPSLIFNAIFDVNIAKEVSKNSPILAKAYEVFDVSNSEQDLLLNLERFLLVKNDEQKFEKYIATLLKMFYDEDLLTEEFLIDWDDGKFNPIFMMDYRFLADKDHKFKTNAKAFVNWLRNAETE